MAKERADVLVYSQGITESREKAKRLIMAGKIYVEEERVLKPGTMYDKNTVFTLRGEPEKYVSRGGYKLEKAIEEFKIDLKDKFCGDFGASTGGFTDCMLQNGAKKVYSIDVGYGQLDWSIRNNDKVIVIERTNLRYLDESLIKEELDFISIDVSFISLTLILPKAFNVIKEDGKIVTLIKPQFEATRKEVGKNGIVKDLEVRRDVINKIYNFVRENGFKMTNLTFSPITGAAGNVEFLAEIEKTGKEINIEKIDEVVQISKKLN